MTFTAQYFSINNGLSGASTAVLQATLQDDDLIRGNDADEVIEGASGLSIFNGFTRFIQTGTGLDSIVREFEDGEATTTVTFNDGSSVSGVLALNDFQSFNFGASSNLFLLDQSALAAVGKTLADVADVEVDAFVDHNLSFADLGFGDAPNTPPIPEPSDETLLLIGTGGRDRLRGTDADEIFFGGDGNDRLIGNGGADTFVFGADAADGGRDRDVIRDFDVAEDVLVLEQGAVIRNLVERNGNTILRLEGDKDTIVLRDVQDFDVADIVFTNDSFLV